MRIHKSEKTGMKIPSVIQQWELFVKMKSRIKIVSSKTKVVFIPENGEALVFDPAKLLFKF